MPPRQKGSSREGKRQLNIPVEPDLYEGFMTLCMGADLAASIVVRAFMREMVRVVETTDDPITLLKWVRTVVETLTTGDETEAVAA